MICLIPTVTGEDDEDSPKASPKNEARSEEGVSRPKLSYLLASKGVSFGWFII